jgi:hypothetical protein
MKIRKESDILHDTSIWGRNPNRLPPSAGQGLAELKELADLKSQLKQERALRKKVEREIEVLKEMERYKAKAEAKAAEAALDPDDDGMLGSGIFVAKPV